jgi:hypothetical protein
MQLYLYETQYLLFTASSNNGYVLKLSKIVTGIIL